MNGKPPAKSFGDISAWVSREIRTFQSATKRNMIELAARIGDLLGRVVVLERRPKWYYPYTPGWCGTVGSPLTSTAFNGDDYSTTAKTLIDLSSTFDMPSGIKAIEVRGAVRDAGSAATGDLFFLLSPNAVAGSYAAAFTPSGQNNDAWFRTGSQLCPCDPNGNVYYQVAASGVLTLDIYLEIWGYLR